MPTINLNSTTTVQDSTPIVQTSTSIVQNSTSTVQDSTPIVHNRTTTTQIPSPHRSQVQQRNQTPQSTGNNTNNNQYQGWEFVKQVKLIDPEAGNIDLEFLLVNSQKITVAKVQEVADAFMIEKDYITFLCFTETKVDCINFIPKGITLQ